MNYTPSFQRALGSLKAVGSFPMNFGRRGPSRRQLRMMRHRPTTPHQARQALVDVVAATDTYTVNCLTERGVPLVCEGDDVLFVTSAMHFQSGSRHTAGGRITEYAVMTGTVSHVEPASGNMNVTALTIRRDDGKGEMVMHGFPQGLWRKAWDDELTHDGIVAVQQQMAELAMYENSVCPEPAVAAH